MVMYDFQERKLADRILYSWPVLFLAGALVAVSLFGVFRNIEKYVKMKREVALAEEKLSKYEASRKRFEEKLSALNTEEGLEKEARARFNLKKPGEAPKPLNLNAEFFVSNALSGVVFVSALLHTLHRA